MGLRECAEWPPGEMREFASVVAPIRFLTIEGIETLRVKLSPP